MIRARSSMTHLSLVCTSFFEVPATIHNPGNIHKPGQTISNGVPAYFPSDAFLKPSKLLRRIEGSGRLRYNGVEIIYSGTLVEEQNS